MIHGQSETTTARWPYCTPGHTKPKSGEQSITVVPYGAIMGPFTVVTIIHNKGITAQAPV